MKTAICYYSQHHGNTRKVLEAMTEGRPVDWIDVTKSTAAHLEAYDVIGLASGIYYGKFHADVLDFTRRCLPEGKDVFFVYTCGSPQSRYTKDIAAAAREKNAHILGEYGCRGFDTYGPFRWIGGMAKGHPNAAELQKGAEFYRALEKARAAAPEENG